MKFRNLYAVMAISVVLAGCANNEITERGNIAQKTEGKPIGVRTYIPRYTRAGDEEGLNKLTQGFTLYATCGEDTIIDGATFYANAETYTCTAADDATYEWPLGNAEVTFYAYYPKTEPYHESNYCNLNILDKTLTLNSYASAVGDDPGPIDVMAAFIKAKETDNNGNVSLEFRHLLSRITMHVKSFEDVPNASFAVNRLMLYAPEGSIYNFETGIITANDASQNLFIWTTGDVSSSEFKDFGTAHVPASSATTTKEGVTVMTTECTVMVNYTVTIGEKTKTYEKTGTFKVSSGYTNEVYLTLTCNLPMSIAVSTTNWQDGEEHIFSTNETNNEAGAHEYVDMGRGLLWATCNLGANKPEEFGDYYAWGETAPHYTVVGNDTIWKSGYEAGYDWSNYKYCMGTDHTLTKYCYSWVEEYGYNGYTDALKELELSDDAANVNWGDDWRIPTRNQLFDLFSDNYTQELTELNGVEGYYIKCKDNDNKIFLPIVGVCEGKSIRPMHDIYYMSRELGEDGPDKNAVLSSVNSYMSCDYRCSGFIVRPVRPAE